MGVFSRIFGGGRASREDWGVISLEIAQGLEGLRKRWFKVCVDKIREGSKKDTAAGPPITIKRADLAGDAARASKAYQLYLVAGFLAQHGYISPSEGRDFADILYAQVCGTELEQCMSFFGRYHEAQSDPGRQLLRFGSDISRHITDKAPLLAAMQVTSTLPAFARLIHIVVADAFGDQKTVAHLKEMFSAGT